MNLTSVRITRDKNKFSVYDGDTLVHTGGTPAMYDAVLRRMVEQGYEPHMEGRETTFRPKHDDDPDHVSDVQGR